MEYKLYKHSAGEKFDKSLFSSPTKEYRGSPFWSWNCKLEEGMLRRQIRALHEMGFGGFHMHSRTGMATPYLSDEFMGLVSACVDEAKKNDMLAYLYDEDRYSSGQAGGLALKDNRFRQRVLTFWTEKHDAVEKEKAYLEGKEYFVAAYDIELDGEGYMVSYKRIGENDKAAHKKFYAYSDSRPDCGWFNNKCHIDTLSKEAMDEFIRITYDAYKKCCGNEYGKTVPSMFSDEPQVAGFIPFRGKALSEPARCPWTYDFDVTYKKTYGKDLLDTLPEIFFDMRKFDERPSETRHNFFDHIAERFTEAFLDNCAARCEKDGLIFTGHVMGEGTIAENTNFLGDCMRTYRRMQLPGVDMLCNQMEIESVKQCQSVVRQYGREGMLSELYGVTNYDFDFRGHKFQGDWQAALGVTLRVPHLSWVSMEGNAKRDYPATINYQAPWYKEYKYVEDHFARVNTVLTRGKASCNVAVINRIESFWSEYGPDYTSNDKCKKYNSGRFTLPLTNTLLFNHIDFDYLSESLLTEQKISVGKELGVGEMTYKTVILCGNRTLRKTTAELLVSFAKAGGRVLIVGKAPEFIGCEKTPLLDELISLSERVEDERYAILTALREERELSIKRFDGTEAPDKLCQLRRDCDGTEYLFIANTDRAYCEGFTVSEPLTISVKGEFIPYLLDTLTGKVLTVDYRHENGNTVFSHSFYINTSALFMLSRTEVDFAETQSESSLSGKHVRVDFRGAVGYETDNKNALLLDLAEYSLDGGEFMPEEEILHLDNICRKLAGLGNRSDHSPQPWVVPEVKPEHTITLMMSFESEIEYDGAELAVERPENADIRFNGESVDRTPLGYYVDESIKRLALGKILKGKNTLMMTIPLGERTNTEWCYILGDFGVKVRGSKKIITERPESIAFGTTTDQGFPFYGHSITYKCALDLEKDADIMITVRRYTAQLIRVYVDGKDCGVIAYSPYKLRVNDLAKGHHDIRFKAYGSLVNTFGPLHYCGKNTWIGPDKWFTTGDDFTYEPNLKPFGILSSPEIDVYEK